MVQSIFSAIRATPPDHEEVTPQEIHVAMSEATVELLSKAESLAGKAFSPRLFEVCGAYPGQYCSAACRSSGIAL